MARYVVLLRGINVGGHNKLPMQALRDLLETLGCSNVTSYIQSGNAVFDFDGEANGLDLQIATSIEHGFGFRPTVLVLRGEVFAQIAAANPFKNEPVEANSLHVSFLIERASAPDHDRLRSLAADTERYALTENAFYLLAPDGLARSKIAANADRCLGVEVTARNWRTVCKLVEMLAL
ncbi:MAG: DUF1697 domain-containing protein [Gammaproteobacteria bacterium]|nr:DUF1697 domain-containing protein [Gammaproteobacteria bacterium]